MTSVSIEVERPAAEVFSYATDPSKFSEWQQGVVSGSMESKGAPAVGDHCRTTRRIGGSERPATSELVRLDPPRAWAVAASTGRSAPRSISLSSHSRTSGRGSPSSSTSRDTGSARCWCHSSCVGRLAPRCLATSRSSKSESRRARPLNHGRPDAPRSARSPRDRSQATAGRRFQRTFAPAANAIARIAATTKSTAAQNGGHHRVPVTNRVRCCQ